MRSLSAADVTRSQGIPITTATRTLLDLAGVLDDRSLARAVHEAEVQGLATNAELRVRLRDSAARRGTPALRELVDDGPRPTRSALEDATLALLQRHGFPRPRTNTRLPGLPDWVEVDFHFAGTGLVVEVDGDRFHSTHWRRRMDARKQALIEDAGYRVIRLTWEQVVHQEQQTVRRLRQALEQSAA